MNKPKLIALTVVACFILVCCSSNKYLIPTQSDVSIAQSHWSGTTLTELTQGYNLYASKCTVCHGYKRPQDYSADEWKTDYLPVMGKRANLTPDEYSLVLHYILTKREEIATAKK